MNRRLFASQMVAGVALLGVPASLLARSVCAPSSALSAAASLKNVTGWIQSGSLGSLQHITLSHVYSPERTSLATLMALLEQDLSRVSGLLGLDQPLSAQRLAGLSASEFGTYSAQLEQDGMTVTWQGLARVGGQAAEPVTRLSLLGSKGIVQQIPSGRGYALIDLQTQRIQSEGQLHGTQKRLNRRNFFTL